MSDKYAGHTPGPWEYDLMSVWGPGGDVGTEIAYVHEFEGNEERRNANGTLLADAPKLLTQRDRLLEALHRITEAVDALPPGGWGAQPIAPKVANIARDAIAEIEGNAG